MEVNWKIAAAALAVIAVLVIVAVALARDFPRRTADMVAARLKAGDEWADPD